MVKRARALIGELEEVVNMFSDMDREWWPFLFLRPAPHQRMSSARVLMLAILYGGFVGMLANVVVALSASASGPRIAVFVFPLLTTFSFFVVFRSTIAYFWNRRAERLAAPALRSEGGL
jgi:hypothetical protein